jgi:NADH-quinone oxidoreductase subunit C
LSEQTSDAPTTSDTADQAPEAGPAPDDLRSGLLATLEAQLGDGIVESHLKPGIGLWVRVTPEAWVDAANAAKVELGCRFFDFLSGIDWMPSPFGRYEDAEVATPESLAAKVEAARAAERETGYAGGATRFQVFAHVLNVQDRHDVFLKVDVPESLALPTISRVYAGANWHERECWEMFGIAFEGHPDLRKLYLPSEFEGNPLRKDFPLLSRVVKPWPGVVDVEPMPGVADEDEEVAAS